MVDHPGPVRSQNQQLSKSPRPVSKWCCASRYPLNLRVLPRTGDCTKMPACPSCLPGNQFSLQSREEGSKQTSQDIDGNADPWVCWAGHVISVAHVINVYLVGIVPTTRKRSDNHEPVATILEARPASH